MGSHVLCPKTSLTWVHVLCTFSYNILSSCKRVDGFIKQDPNGIDWVTYWVAYCGFCGSDLLFRNTLKT